MTTLCFRTNTSSTRRPTPFKSATRSTERAHAAAESEQPETPPPVDTPTRRDDLTVYLLLPAAEEAALTQLLSTLENYQSHATLLLTPELLESAGDGVRRAAATGNAVALCISAETADEALAQIERGNDALWRAASLRTRLVYLESADKTLRAAVVGAGYCPITINTSDFTRSGTHWADTALKWAGRSTSVRLYLGAESGVSSAPRHGAQPPARGELHDRGAERGHGLIKPLQNVQEKHGKPIIIRTFQR